jgi:hypothetical protein
VLTIIVIEFCRERHEKISISSAMEAFCGIFDPVFLISTLQRAQIPRIMREYERQAALEVISVGDDPAIQERQKNH